jgi:uncharacterized membrane protein YGL010W
MKTLLDHLAQYAAYHRDRRNIATHFVGIPMIVLGVATLLARPAFAIAGLPIALSPAVLVTLGTVLFYFRLDVRFGLLMTALMTGALTVGSSLAASTTGVWLGAGLGLFAVGWVIQFVGHYYEGKKPAFVDDLVGLAVGPLFVTAEVVFALGFRKDLLAQIEERVGPTIIRDLKKSAAAA